MVELKKSRQTHISTAQALISQTCVNNCIFCAPAEKRKSHLFAKRKDIIKFMQKCADSGVSNMIFSGIGEPTLDDNFSDYLAIANSLGFDRIRLFTNGYNLTTKKAREWKNSGLSEILLSIHGVGKSHDKNVQRKGAFKEAMHALEIFTKLGYTVSVNTCLTRININDIPMLRKLLLKYPIKTHTLSFPEWTGNVEHFSNLHIDYEELCSIDLDNFIPSEDTATCFDNIPYCFVKKRMREMKGLAPIHYLDGKNEMELHPNEQKVFLQCCSEQRCPFLGICPGFERNYISNRGWGGIKERVSSFLNTIKSTNLKELHTQKNPVTKEPDYSHKNELTIIVKPTNRCNGECVYCSSFKLNTSSDMDEFLLEKFYSELFSYAQSAKIKRMSILWHGGEPLLLGKDFYKKAWDTSRSEKEFLIRHMIQTNLLNVDEEWIDLFRRFNVNISTSVDPIGKARVYKNKSLQYPDWLEKFILVCNNNLNIGIVFTITSYHLNRVNEIYIFFKNIQSLSSKPIGIKFNPAYSAGKAISGRGQSLTIQPKDYGIFLTQLWELWKNDGRPFPVSPFKEWLSPEETPCEFSGNCHNTFLSINNNGNIFNCGRFLDNDSSLGNINEKKLSVILKKNPWRLKLSERKKSLESRHCKGCKFWKYCRGGCPYFAEIYSGDYLKASPYCSTIKEFFNKTDLIKYKETHADFY